MYLGRNKSAAQRGAHSRKEKGHLAGWTACAPAGLVIMIDSASTLPFFFRGWHVIFNKNSTTYGLVVHILNESIYAKAVAH